jgi:DASH family cryptochrome
VPAVAAAIGAEVVYAHAEVCTEERAIDAAVAARLKRVGGGGGGGSVAAAASPSPIGSTPVGSTPVGSTPVGSTPVGSTPVGSTPVGSTPVGSTPVGSTPVGAAPPARRAAPARLVSLWGGATMHHPSDLPFRADDPRGLPAIFSQFRRRVEADVALRAPLAEPAS